MRSMIVSVCFFTVSLAAIVINSFFLTSHFESVLALLEELPAEVSGEISRDEIQRKTEEISKLWNKKLNFISLSINTAELRDTTISIENLCAFESSEEVADFLAAVSEAIIRVRTLYERERISFSNIV